jgi:hypothetical protein
MINNQNSEVNFPKLIFYLAEQFQRRRLKCEKLTDDRRRTPSEMAKAHLAFGKVS